jgi:hypothetical protein
MTHSRRRELIQVAILGAFTLLVLGGLVAIPFEGRKAIREVEAMSERSEAEVARIVTTRSKDAVYRFPVYRWEHAGTLHQHESITHESHLSVGDRVPIRFDPDEPNRVVQDRWGSLYGDLTVLFVMGPLVLILFALSSHRLIRDVRALARKQP